MNNPQRAARSKNWPHYVLPACKPYRLSIMLAALGALLTAGLQVLKPWPLKIVIDRVLLHHASRVPFVGRQINHAHLPPVTLLNLACTATLVLAVVTGALNYYSMKVMGEVGQKVVFELRQNLFAHLQRLSLRFHDRQRTGDLITRLTSDIQAVQDAIASGIVVLINNTCTLLGMLGMMFWLDWRFALAALSITPLLCFTVFRSAALMKQAARRARKSDGLLAAIAQETLYSIRMVQALSQEERQERLFRSQSEDSLSAYLDTNRFQAAIAPVVDLLAAGGLIIVMRYGAMQVMQGAISTGDVVIFFAYITGLYRPIRQLSRLSLTLNKAAIGLERAAAILDEKPDVQNLPEALPAPGLTGDIRFENVSYAYTPGRYALSHISLHIHSGETIAIIGATGAGKSTLSGLIPRLYDATEGRILLDGCDIRDMELGSVRDQIALVFQESLLFSGTLRENIAFGAPPVTDSQIEEAAKTANIWEFIQSLPQGLDTPVAERGSTLSGGQKQRIAIARAVLRHASILILDEPTSGLDPLAEAGVMKALQKAAQGRTTILIAHRMATTRFAHRVVVLEKGKIVEAGPPAELLQQNSRYAEFCRMQHEPESAGSLATLPC